MYQNDLNEIISSIRPWANSCRDFVMVYGRKLTNHEIEFASKIGIKKPDMIRLLKVKQIPKPEVIKKKILSIHEISSITFGYAILTVEEKDEIIRHELGHVLQTERIGSMIDFFKVYFEQIIHYGYQNAPLETEASNYEQR